MGISGIPAAANYVTAYSARSGQGGNTLHCGVGTKIQKLTFASDVTDYTKKDALLEEWRRRGRFSIDLTTGKTTYADPSGKYWNPNPGENELRELEQELQTNGLPEKFDWAGLEYDLTHIGVQFGQAGLDIEAGELTRKSEYLASRYVAAAEQIKNTAGGDARAEELKKLDAICQEALEKLAGGYSEKVGSFLDKNGVRDEKEKIYDSIVDGVKSKIEDYRKALSGNTTLEGLKGTRDAWLLGSNSYVASVLRASVSGSEKTERSDGSYTLDDLETLGQYASSLDRLDGPCNEVNRTFCMDEARLGVDYAMLDMKTDQLCGSGRVSGRMAELLRRTKDGFMRSYLERVDRELAANREKGGAPDDTKGYAALDRSAVWEVYRYTMQEYRRGGDAIRALLSGVQFGARKTAELLESGQTYRAKDSAWFWSGFFERNQRRYESPDSAYQKYLAGWRDFEASLSNGNAVRMNLELKGSEYYAAGCNSSFNHTA